MDGVNNTGTLTIQSTMKDWKMYIIIFPGFVKMEEMPDIVRNEQELYLRFQTRIRDAL